MAKSVTLCRLCVTLGAKGVTLRVECVTLCGKGVTLHAESVTLHAESVTLGKSVTLCEMRCHLSYGGWGSLPVDPGHVARITPTWQV